MAFRKSSLVRAVLAAEEKSLLTTPKLESVTPAPGFCRFTRLKALKGRLKAALFSKSAFFRSLFSRAINGQRRCVRHGQVGAL
jgi:hypothetical protein